MDGIIATTTPIVATTTLGTLITNADPISPIVAIIMVATCLITVVWCSQAHMQGQYTHMHAVSVLTHIQGQNGSVAVPNVLLPPNGGSAGIA